MSAQQTLRRAVALEGVGLHTGERVRAVLKPAAGGEGIRFLRVDLAGAAPIPATVQYVVDTRFATTLGDGRSRVHTVEHLLAALAGCGIDNALVELDGPEVPILDGSAWPFVEAIEAVGLLPQEAPSRAFRLLEAVAVGSPECGARLVPAETFSLSCTIGFDHPRLRHQALELEWPLSGTSASCAGAAASGAGAAASGGGAAASGSVASPAFRDALARARTFGFLHEVEAMREAGLIRGAGLENALVLGGDGWLNPEGPRYGDEPVRHKALDAIGDLALIGGRLLARYEGVRAGHTLNVALVRAALTRGRWAIAGEA